MTPTPPTQPGAARAPTPESREDEAPSAPGPRLDAELRDLYERLKAEGRTDDAKIIDNVAWAVASAEAERDWAQAKYGELAESTPGPGVEKDDEGRPYQCGAFVSDDARWECRLASDHAGDHEWWLGATPGPEAGERIEVLVERLDMPRHAEPLAYYPMAEVEDGLQHLIDHPDWKRATLILRAPSQGDDGR